LEIRYVGEPSYRMTWDEVEAICRDTALEAARSFGPDAVVGIAKGGLIPATIIASILRVDLYPCLVTRKRRGEIISDRPQVIVSVSEKVAGQRALVVDEMVMTGETMRVVAAQCRKEKARLVKTAALWAGSESWKPTWYGMETAGFIMFPWDYEVLARGKFVLNPVYQEYLDSVEMISRWEK
jgi:hypothetical protein